MNGTGGNDLQRLEGSASVRPEYLKLPADLRVLTRSYGIELSPLDQQDVLTLTLAVECADRWLDAISIRSARTGFSAAILACLGDDNALSGDRSRIPPELSHRLDELRRLFARRSIHDRGRHLVGELLRNSEAMRQSRRGRQFVECAVREGQLLVDLLLLVLGLAATRPFARFMRRLAGPANLVDKLRDARRDFAAGELAIRPSLGFRLRLWLGILVRLGPLVSSALRRPRLLAWGLNALPEELAGVRPFLIRARAHKRSGRRFPMSSTCSGSRAGLRYHAW